MRFLFSSFLLLSFMTWLPADLHAGRVSRLHDFAQVADGGGFRTVFLIMNQGTVAVTVTLKFFDDNGNPLSLTVGSDTGTEIVIQMTADSVQIVSTPGTGATTLSGWCNLTATGEVGAQILFESLDGQQQIISQAAVESIGSLTVVDIFVNEGQTTNTGFAVANLSETGEIRVRLTFTDDTGALVGTTDLILAPRGHIATFVFQQIANTLGKTGRLRIETSGPIAVVALQLTQGILGTLTPIIPFIR